MNISSPLHRLRRQRRLRRGATVVEFAVVAPIFLVMVFGLIEMGRLVMIHQALTSAAREGCRQAALATTRSESDVEATVRRSLQGVIPNAKGSDKLNIQVASNELSDNISELLLYGDTLDASSGLESVASGEPVTVAVQVNVADVSWLARPLLKLSDDLALTAVVTLSRE